MYKQDMNRKNTDKISTYRESFLQKRALFQVTKDIHTLWTKQDASPQCVLSAELSTTFLPLVLGLVLPALLLPAAVAVWLITKQSGERFITVCNQSN